jgi:hypothetical protein
VLQFQGFDAMIVNGAVVPGCPRYSAAEIRGVATEVQLQLVGTRWRARPQTSAGGEFELWLHDGPYDPEFAPGGVGVAAMATGTVVNTRYPNALVGGSRLLFGEGSGTLFSGGVARSGEIASGLLSSPVQFVSPEGETVSCNPRIVLWSLSRLHPSL